MDLPITEYELVVKTSEIKDAGNGVFAVHNIPNHNIIGVYEGLRLKHNTPLLENEVKYPYATLRNEIIIPYKTCIFRYINDAIDLEISASVNYRVNLRHFNVRFREINNIVYIMTIRDIKAGDELYIDYGDEYWFLHILDRQRKILKKKAENFGGLDKQIILRKRRNAIEEQRYEEEITEMQIEDREEII